MLRLRGKVHGTKFPGKRAPGTTEDISRAQSIRRYLLSYMGSVSLSSGGAISVLHIYCRHSALISLALSLLSLLLAIVSHTSGSYVIVVELSRLPFSTSSHHPHGTDFISSEDWPAKRIPERFTRTLHLKHLEVDHGIARPHFFAFPLPR